MKFIEFKNTIRNFPIFSTDIIHYLTENEQVLKNQLVYWEKQGLLTKLKKGFYVLSNSERRITPSRAFIANFVYPPSYVSCEYALSFYGFIPEKVVDITSVTTKKTAIFKNIFGVFRYQHIKPECFKGFKELKDENTLSFFIAEPEKAIVDFFYLNLSSFRETSNQEIFELSYRFQNVSGLNKEKLRNYAQEFRSKKLNSLVTTFVRFIDSTW